MIYRILVDGEEKYEERAFRDYSPETDGQIREDIVRHYLTDEAKEATIVTTAQEVYNLHKVARKFYELVMEWEIFFAKLSEREWGVAEMGQLIPILMKLYMAAMKLPEPEFVEDAEPSEIEWGAISFPKEKYQSYWMIYDPYQYFDSDGRTDEPCMGSLVDDILDIHCDLHEGIEAYESGLICLALVDWKCMFCCHWGDHVSHALLAMTSVYLRADIDKE